MMAAVVMSGVAKAEDVYTPHAYDWSGLYFGANVGGIAIDSNIGVPGHPTSSASPQGTTLTFGGQIGYRHQFDRIVVGLQGDAGWQDNSVSTAELYGASGQYWDLRSNWHGSIQGSLGLAFDRAMIYGMGGIAFTNIDGCGNLTSGAMDACDPQVLYSGGRTGWTIGGGLAYALTDSLSTNVEYHYADYGSVSYDTPHTSSHQTTVDYHPHTFTLGLQYKF